MHDLAAGYALGVLDEDERRAFDEHLQTCAECRDELAALGAAAAALAYAAEGPAPPGKLRERILDTARADRRRVLPLRTRRWSPARAAAVAAAACLALGLGLWATLGAGGPGRSPESIALKGALGTLAVGRSGDALLTVRRLGPAPAGKAYEIWVIDKGKPAPAGLFARGGREVIVPLARKVPRGSTVAVTLERAGGVDAPTGRILFEASVPA